MSRRLVLALAFVVALAAQAEAQGLVRGVGPIGMTVSDMERSIVFYSRALDFAKVSDVEVWGPDWDRLQGVFGLRMRVVRMRLGDETLELTEYLTPRGRPMPADSRGNDRWFQHVAIIVSDMDRAYAQLRAHGCNLPDRRASLIANKSADRLGYLVWYIPCCSVRSAWHGLFYSGSCPV